MTLTLFHLSLLIITFVSSFLVYSIEHPVYSILLLIVTFFNASICIFIFQCDFLAFLFIIVYVGAIAILFLFVVMMLKIKTFPVKEFKYYFLIFFCLLVLAFFIHRFLSEAFYDHNFSVYKSLIEIDFDYNSIVFLGQALYNYFAHNLLIVGIILLVALIGCVCLVYDYDTSTLLSPSSKSLARTSHIATFKKE